MPDAEAGGCEQLGLGIPLVPRGRDDDDLRDLSREDAVERMPEHRVLVDADERLGRDTAQTCSGTRRDDDDRRRGHRDESHTLTLARPEGLGHQDARTSSSSAPALSSSHFSASASSEMRI